MPQTTFLMPLNVVFLHGERTCHSFIYFPGHNKTASGRTKTTNTNLILITLPVLYRVNQAKAMFQECNNEYIKPRGEQCGE
ncbi:transposase, partial [Enterobacter cloacae]